MKTFEEYLDKMGYSWNDFDRTYEMESLIEQYADEKIKQALSLGDVVGRSEQLVCDCKNCKPFPNHAAGFRKNKTCINDKTNNEKL